MLVKQYEIYGTKKDGTQITLRTEAPASLSGESLKAYLYGAATFSNMTVISSFIEIRQLESA